MSKSLGNVIDPLAIVAEYGTDALRYFLARQVHPFEDSDVTMDKFKETYNADLANGLGNLVARVLTLSEKYVQEPVVMPEGIFSELDKTFRFDRYLEYVWNLAQGLDRFINETKPFGVIKDDPEKGKELIKEAVRTLYSIVFQLRPFMPETSRVIEDAILKNKKPANLFPRKE